jgi:hypothetical protein
VREIEAVRLVEEHHNLINDFWRYWQIPHGHFVGDQLGQFPWLIFQSFQLIRLSHIGEDPLLA